MLIVFNNAIRGGIKVLKNQLRVILKRMIYQIGVCRRWVCTGIFRRIHAKTTKAIDIAGVRIAVNRVTAVTTRDGVLWMIITKARLISKKNARRF